MIEYKQCRKCVNKNLSLKSGFPIADPGYIVYQELGPDGKTMVDKLQECECHKAWREKHKLEIAAKMASLSPEWINYDLRKDYVGTQSQYEVGRIIKYVELSTSPTVKNDIKNKLACAVLYLYGTNGTQKTTIANWMGYEFLRAGKSVRYILMNDLIKLLQKADRDEEVQAHLEKLTDVDLLLIDEAFDKEKVTIYRSNFQIPFLDSFLRNRMQTKHKGIVFISNVHPTDIEEGGFNHSVMDLVTRNIQPVKGLLEFKDRYADIMSMPDTEDLF